MNALRVQKIVPMNVLTLKDLTIVPVLVDMNSRMTVIPVLVSNSHNSLLYTIIYKIQFHLIQPHMLYLDIDECTGDTDNCTDGCVNTEGSYYCTCPGGYELSGDNNTCVGE